MVHSVWRHDIKNRILLPVKDLSDAGRLPPTHKVRVRKTTHRAPAKTLAHLAMIFDASTKTEEPADPVFPSDKSISAVPILKEKLF